MGRIHRFTGPFPPCTFSVMSATTHETLLKTKSLTKAIRFAKELIMQGANLVLQAVPNDGLFTSSFNEFNLFAQTALTNEISEELQHGVV